MIEILYNRFNNIINEEQFRKLIRKGWEHNYLERVSITVDHFKNSNLYKNLSYKVKDLIDYCYGMLIIYKKLDQIYLIGIPDYNHNSDLLEKIKVYSYKCFEEYCFLIISARNEEEASKIIKEYTLRAIDSDCLNIIDDVRIETIPRIINIIGL